jgi:plastocyanin
MAMKRAVAVWAAAVVISGGLLALPLVALAATSAVNIQSTAFAPKSIAVSVGDTVTWTNRDPFSHTTTSDTGAWDSGALATGHSFSFRFTRAGTFAYHCSIHTFMTGTIVVQAVSTPQPTAAPTAPPTPVLTTPPTIAPTEPPTPTEAPTPQATTAAPSASASPVAAPSETAATSPRTVAAQLTPAPATGGGGLGPLLIGAAALAVVALGGIAFLRARRRS